MNRKPKATPTQIFQLRCRYQVSATNTAITTSAGGACNSHRMPAIRFSSTSEMASNRPLRWIFIQSKITFDQAPMGILYAVSQSMPPPSWI